eukprot:3307161-Pyramimonas_sp.AAC.1
MKCYCTKARLKSDRCLCQGPFATFPAHPDPANRTPYTSLQFSYDGRSIMATSPGKIVTIDAYKVLRPSLASCLWFTSSPGVDGQKGLRLQFNSR